MWDRIVYMQQIEFFIQGDIHDLGRESGFIGWVFEQGIVIEIHLMVIQVLMEGVKSEGLFVGDEMHLVTVIGQGFAQFSGYHAAASVSRVTYYSDLHWALLMLW